MKSTKTYPNRRTVSYTKLKILFSTGHKKLSALLKQVLQAKFDMTASISSDPVDVTTI